MCEQIPVELMAIHANVCVNIKNFIVLTAMILLVDYLCC